ncbi:hypothetical protein COU54_04420 [Candidatus Pacearchaeota archaeon CG10_big_fil_rev_8_21_14_0_10_31_24]|nr:MAG: hypothetical protein COU54_04420 [Candidatus Pacearchaeota archaeon CG10_big_fil_rev_8_21_14_0_10_31_24]
MVIKYKLGFIILLEFFLKKEAKNECVSLIYCPPKKYYFKIQKRGVSNSVENQRFSLGSFTPINKKLFDEARKSKGIDEEFRVNKKI